MPSRQIRRLALACAGTLLGPWVAAQDSHPYNDTWRVAYTNKAGVAREGKVVINGNTGSWDMIAVRRNNPCTVRAFPITVTAATSTALQFDIQRAAALPGCTDGTARLRRIDDNTVEGGVDDIRFRMLREPQAAPGG